MSVRSKNNETQANDQAHDWKNIISNTFHDLFARSWAQNIIGGTALLLIAPLLGFIFMRDLRGMLFGAGIGLTVLFWIGWCSLIKHATPGKNAESRNGKTEAEMKDEKPNINISSQNQSGGFTGVNTGTLNLTPPPRVITPEQSERLKQSLANTPRGRITMRFPITEAESGKFADKLCKRLRELGFDVGDPVLAALSGYPNGLCLIINPEDKESKMVFDLQSALKEAGFPAPAYLETGIPTGTVEIQVGPSPQ